MRTSAFLDELNPLLANQDRFPILTDAGYLVAINQVVRFAQVYTSWLEFEFSFEEEALTIKDIYGILNGISDSDIYTRVNNEWVKIAAFSNGLTDLGNGVKQFSGCKLYF